MFTHPKRPQDDDAGDASVYPIRDLGESPEMLVGADSAPDPGMNEPDPEEDADRVVQVVGPPRIRPTQP